MIADEATYKILGVIDWEGAYSAPVEFLELPLLLQTVPKAMDPPSNYGEDGLPTDEDSRRRLEDRST
jgi:hypothetical protein